MSNFRHSLKSNLKNPIDNISRKSNFKIEVNYVNSTINSVESSIRLNNNISYKSNIILDNEMSNLSNFKFMKTRNSVSKMTSSGVKNLYLKSNNNTLYSSSTNNNAKFRSSLDNIKSKKNKYLNIKNENMSRKISKTPKANPKITSRKKGSLFLNFAQNYNIPEKRKSSALTPMMDNTQSFDYFDNNERLLRINEKIQNELETLALKKKVNLMKKTIINLNSSKDIINLLSESDETQSFKKSDFKKSNIKKSNIKKSLINKSNINKSLINKSNINKSLINKSNINKSNIHKSNIYKSNINKSNIYKSNINKSNKNILLDITENSQNNLKEKSEIIVDNNNSKNKYDEKFRKLERIKEIFDSFDDEEYEEEMEIDYYISPNSYFIIIFDWIIFLSSMFYLIYVPYIFSKNRILVGEGKVCSILLILIDFFYILDLIINCFRAYHNFDEKLERRTKIIFLHYLQTWLLFDLIQAIPYYTIFAFLEKRCIYYNLCLSEGYNYNHINPILYLIILIKIFKAYKMLKENNAISSFGEILSENEFIDNYNYIFFSIFYSLCFLNLSSSLFIYLGRNSYPGWIMKINIYDESYINIYVTSVYYILVTITTVGYGDITGSSYPEITYQMFLLIIGTLAYSFIVSYISNYIVKSNHKSIAFEKNVSILKEIKRQNPHLKDSIYKEVLKNLFNEQLYEKNDKSVLFDCLPYTLKNKLIIEIYKPFINNLVLFKGVENSDFIVKVVTSLKPLLSFKGDILIQEGDFIKEIFFVKKGILVLNICVDKEDVEESMKKYIDINELGTIRIAYMPSLLKKNTTMNLDNNFDNLYFLSQKTKTNNKLNTEKTKKKTQIRIIEIRKNEHFGDALMFLNERSPLVVKVKSKTAELLVLRKMEAIEIYCIYPNIWKRINKKSLFNMEQIKLKIKKEIMLLAQKYGANAERNVLHNSRILHRFISLQSLNNIAKESLGIKGDKKKNKKKQKKKKSEKRISHYKNLQMEVIEEKNENKDEEKSRNEKEENENNTQEKEDIMSFNIKNNKTNTIINNNKSETFKEEKQLVLDTQEIRSGIGNEENSFSKKTKKTNIYISKSSSSNDLSFNLYKNKNQPNYKQEKDEKNTKIKKKIVKHKSMNTFKCKKDKDSNKVTNTTSFHYKRDLMTESEKLLFPSFSNLSTSNEKSFELISSYENINKITNNIYIKNSSLQSKTKLFLINECSTISNESPKDHTNITKKISNKKLINRKKKLNTFTTDDFKIEDEDKKSVNSLDISKLKSTKKVDLFNLDSYSPSKGRKLLKLKKIGSAINIESANSNIKSKASKKRRKSDCYKVNEKLHMITRNIKGANRNINNPNEFYMDFFNNIIKQETGGLEKKEEKKIINNNNSHTNVIPIKKFNITEKTTQINKKKILNSVISENINKKQLLKHKTSKFQS